MSFVCATVVINGSISCNGGVVAVVGVAEGAGWNSKDNGKLSNALSTACDRFSKPSDHESLDRPVEGH
jgi:hypothetical protein